MWITEVTISSTRMNRNTKRRTWWGGTPGTMKLAVRRRGTRRGGWGTMTPHSTGWRWMFLLLSVNPATRSPRLRFLFPTLLIFLSFRTTKMTTTLTQCRRCGRKGLAENGRRDERGSHQLHGLFGLFRNRRRTTSYTMSGSLTMRRVLHRRATVRVLHNVPHFKNRRWR